MLQPSSASENAISASRVISASLGLNCPYWSSATVSGPAIANSATDAGMTMRHTSRTAQASVAENSSGDFLACCEDRLGRITVASAMLNTPSGNSTSRSA